MEPFSNALEAASRKQWLQARRRGMGGTDAAAILHLSPYRTPYQVWLEKTAELEQTPDTEAMWWGRRLEAIIADRYAEKMRCTLTQPGLVVSKANPLMQATPDRLVLGQRRGLEIKTASAHDAHHWGPAGTDDVPAGYFVQCMHYMHVTDLPVWDLAVLIGGSDFRIYHINRDTALEASMVRYLLQWWHDHVVAMVAPPIQGTKAIADVLARRFPVDGGTVMQADAQLAGFMVMLKAARSDEADASARRLLAENNLKAAMGEASEVVGPDGLSVTWKAARPSLKTHWEGLAMTLLEPFEPEQRAEMIAEHTASVPGSRRFLFRDRGGKDGQH